ncbi:hypothetical protein FE633_10160 [Streptomyces montanus]|uniref:Uncharacterized protein n=1 Tax=Streptomyces montanus TaxID=2580423 RepID=A0A5R9FZX5_9ACTN|nr:hypothetical protein [Streptomyces montanus]TLS46293.1 hypothetical protein FE633_10160 [Streptomyces montanus]
MPANPPPPIPTSARTLLCVHTALALLMTQVPPLFPPVLPAWRAPLWYAIALVTGILTALVTVRPRTPRAVLLGLGWLQVLLALVNGFLVGDIAALLLASWLAVSALALLAGQLRKNPRKALVAAHVVSSAAWVGIGVVFVALSAVALTATDLHTVHVTYELMEKFDQTLLPWANVATTLTGIALGMTTKWGLIRYRWVAIKLGISIGILVAAFSFLHDAVVTAVEQSEQLMRTGGTVAQIGANADVVLWGFTTALFSLVAALLLSLYKPGGKTRRGRRQAARPTRQASAARA